MDACARLLVSLLLLQLRPGGFALISSGHHCVIWSVAAADGGGGGRGGESVTKLLARVEALERERKKEARENAVLGKLTVA